MTQFINRSIEFGVDQWGHLITIFLLIYGIRNIFYLFRRRDKLQTYTLMSLFTFWAVITIPVLNLYLKEMKLNDISPDRLVFLITVLLGVKVIIAVSRLEIYTGVADFLRGKKQMGLSMAFLLFIIVRYLDLGYLESDIYIVIFTPYIAYYVYLWYYLKKTRNDIK